MSELQSAIQAALDEEQIRWQNAIADAITRTTEQDAPSGAGCESGDPLDYSLAQIRLALIALIDERDELREENERWKVGYNKTADERDTTRRERDETREALRETIGRAEDCGCDTPEWRDFFAEQRKRGGIE